MFLNDERKVRSGWLILIAFIAMTIAQFLFSIPGSIALTLSQLSVENPGAGSEVAIDQANIMDQHPWIFLIIQGGSSIGAIITILLLWKFLNKQSIREIGFSGSMKHFGFGLFLGAISITAMFFILLASGNIALTNAWSNPDFSIYTLSFLILFIIVGLFEEIFFRGYIMSTMTMRGNKKWLVYTVSAVVFGFAHLLNPNVSILGIINIIMVGLLFAYMFDATKSLWLPIGYHITWNYFQGNVFGFAVSGTTPNGIYNTRLVGDASFLTGGAFGLEGGILTTLFIIIGFTVTRIYAKRQIAYH